MGKRSFSCHVQMEVKSALNMSDKALADWFGEPVTEVKTELLRQKASGRQWLHTEGCDNEDPVTGKCLKHYK
jgi:hypothetical protein